MSTLSKLKEPMVKEHGFQYADRKESGYTILSPSGMNKFYTDIKEWKTNVIDGNQTFFGNQATMMGSIVHLYAEYFREKKLTKEGKLPSIALDSMLSSSTDLDIKDIYSNYPIMCESLKENYLDIYPQEVLTEHYMEFELEDKILLAGTVDEIDVVNKICTDFKTSGKPYKDETDLAKHFVQLSVYHALTDKIDNIEIDTYRIVNIVKPTKTIGARVVILECDSDLEYGKKIINEVYQATLLSKKNKDLLDMLFKDNPMKGFTLPSKESMEAYCSKYIKNFKVVTAEENKIAKIKKNIFA